MDPDMLLTVNGRQCSLKDAWGRYLLSLLDAMKQRTAYDERFPVLNSKILQFNFAVEQKNNLLLTGHINPNVRNQQLLEAQQWEPMGTERDQKKAHVMFWQQELADLELQIDTVRDEMDEAGVIARLPSLAANRLVLLSRCRLRERLNAADDDDLLRHSVAPGPDITAEPAQVARP